MLRSSRKFVAVFMLLWLPISSGSALAASLAMQLQQGECHESAEMMSMSHDDMMDHDMMAHGHEAMQASAEGDSGCTACGVCHLACTAYLDTPVVAMQLAAPASQAISSIPETFVSHLSAPLDPPPLARV
jgi:ferredoxin